MSDRLAEIRARADAATPGRWAWRGTVDSHGNGIHLRAIDARMRPDVMDVRRKGMQGAEPWFNAGSDRLMIQPAHELAVFEVCPEATERSDPRVYRGDIVGIRHPDAEFMAHSRSDVDYLLERVTNLEAAIAGCYEI